VISDLAIPYFFQRAQSASVVVNVWRRRSARTTRRGLRLGASLGIILSLLSTLIVATPLADSSTLSIDSDLGARCPTGGCPRLNGELNDFGPTDADLYQKQNEPAVRDNSVQLSLGVPSNSATAGLTGADLSPLAFRFNTSSRHAGSMDSGENGVLDSFGISPPTGYSSSHPNLPTIGEIDIGGGPADPNSINVRPGNAPDEAFAPHGQGSIHLDDVPSIEAGPAALTVSVPEPSAFALFASGVLVLGFVVHCRRAV
jgi:hypothetical protein